MCYDHCYLLQNDNFGPRQVNFVESDREKLICKLGDVASSRTSSRLSMQNYEAFVNALTEKDWNVLQGDAVPDDKLDQLQRRLALIGLRNPSEQTSKKIAAIYSFAVNGENFTEQDAAMKRSLFTTIKSTYKKYVRGLPEPKSWMSKLVTVAQFSREHPSMFASAYGDELPVACPIDMATLMSWDDFKCRVHPTVATPMQSLVPHRVLAPTDGANAMMMNGFATMFERMMMMMQNGMQQQQQPMQQQTRILQLGRSPIQLEAGSQGMEHAANPRLRRELTIKMLNDQSCNSSPNSSPRHDDRTACVSPPQHDVAPIRAPAKAAAATPPAEATPAAAAPLQLALPAGPARAQDADAAETPQPANSSQPSPAEMGGPDANSMLDLLDAREKSKKSAKNAQGQRQLSQSKAQVAPQSVPKKRRLTVKTAVDTAARVSAPSAASGKPQINLNHESTRSQYLVRCGKGKGSTKNFKYLVAINMCSFSRATFASIKPSHQKRTWSTHLEAITPDMFCVCCACLRDPPGITTKSQRSKLSKTLETTCVVFQSREHASMNVISNTLLHITNKTSLRCSSTRVEAFSLTSAAGKRCRVQSFSCSVSGVAAHTA